MNQLVDSDAPIMKLPPLGRLVVIISTALFIGIMNAHLAYLVTAAPTPLPVTQNNIDESQVIADEGEVANLCDLTDVVCDSETKTPIAQNTIQPRSVNTVVKKGASKTMQEMVDYAWSISKSIDFILTIEAESGFNPKAIGKNKNGTRDHGIAQINDYWHKNIVKDSRFSDWKFQLEQGWELYKGGTRFYGYDVRNKVRNRFVMK